MQDYSDIINKKRPEHSGDAFSAKHPKMPRLERAKIFAPFSALKGFKETTAKREVFKAEEFEFSEDIQDDFLDTI